MSNKSENVGLVWVITELLDWNKTAWQRQKRMVTAVIECLEMFRGTATIKLTD